MIVPTFTCPHCQKDSKPEVDMTGEIPVGTMVLCDCPESRAAWEAEHRATIERRKNAARGGMRSRSIIHAGRVPVPNKRYK